MLISAFICTDESEEEGDYDLTDKFIAAEDDDEEEGGEGTGTVRRKKKKKRRRESLELEDEDYDLLEENQVTVRSCCWFILVEPETESPVNLMLLGMYSDQHLRPHALHSRSLSERRRTGEGQPLGRLGVVGTGLSASRTWVP